MLYLRGRPLWFRRINAIETFSEILEYADKAASGTAEMPSSLTSRSFSWTGGGIGPAPPVSD